MAKSRSRSVTGRSSISSTGARRHAKPSARAQATKAERELIPAPVREEDGPVPLRAERVEPSAPPPETAAHAPQAPACAVPKLSRKQLEAKIRELIDLQGTHPDDDLVEDLIVTALRTVRDGTTRGELKIMAAALRELRYAFEIFREYTHHRKITVFGSARTPPTHPEYEQARRFSAEMVARGFMVITGAGPGIMEAAQGGAGRDKSFGVNIRLPFEQSANPVIHGDRKLIHFRYFFTRKLCFVKEASAIALFPGGFGTHDEGFETLTLVQTGKAGIVPIVFIDKPGGSYWREWADYVADHLLGKGLISPDDMSLFKVTDDPMWAADEISQFYRRYHSSRFVKDRLVIRMLSPLPEGAIDRLNREFSELFTKPRGGVRAGNALPEEADQPDLAALPRLILDFNRRGYGRLRQFIDAINRD
ncbi:MAG: LOG family protein [Planctomycetota bacterium]|nr:LOG family protein [Planctomycetota bacterium]